MSITHRIENNICIVYLTGNIVEEVTSEIKTTIENLAQDRDVHGLVINLKQVDFLSVSGVGVIWAITNTFKAIKKQLVLCQLDWEIIKLLTYVRLDKAIPFYFSEEEALADIQQIV